MEMKFLPDIPISKEVEDTFSFQTFADLIKSSIDNTGTPFVYGVLGDWGSGKTSVLNLLKAKLEASSSQLVPIWFNAWKYENEENMIYPLLYTIKNHYEMNRSEKTKDEKFSRSLLKTVMASAFVATDIGLRLVTKKFLGETLKLEDVTKKLELVEAHAKELDLACSTWADQISELQQNFENLLEQYASDLASSDQGVNKDTLKFVLLIDDLDRCLPDTAIDMLESLKNFLSVKHSVFVLGLNPDIIHKGIKIKYKGLEIDGRKYLEKFLNYSFYVPEPAVNDIKKFARDRLSDLVLDADLTIELSPYFDEFGLALSKCNFNNPRKIKRILNRYLFFLSRYQPGLGNYISHNIVRLLVLAEYYPELFNLYLRNSAATSQLTNIGDLDFDVDAFESKYNVNISANYHEFLKMSSLFEMKLIEEGQATLTGHARAVHSINSAGQEVG